MPTDPDVVVLRQNIHGIPPDDYVQALEARLPGREVAYAATPETERDLLPGATVVAVTNASGVHAPNVSEYALGAVLTFARGFLESRRRQKRREWRSHQVHELAGSTVAVVGMGAIGQSVVDRLDAFDVHTVGVRYTPEKGGPTDEVYGYDDVSEAVGDAASVVLACPLTDATEHLVDAEVFLTMPPASVLVNVARGGVVDTRALVDALRANSVRGAALDVTDPEPLPEDHPLWGFENVLVTPHNAGHTPEYFERLADIVADAVHAADESGEWEDLPNQVVYTGGQKP